MFLSLFVACPQNLEGFIRFYGNFVLKISLTRQCVRPRYLKNSFGKSVDNRSPIIIKRVFNFNYFAKEIKTKLQVDHLKNYIIENIFLKCKTRTTRSVL